MQETREAGTRVRPVVDRPPLLGKVTLLLAFLNTLGLGVWRPGGVLAEAGF